MRRSAQSKKYLPTWVNKPGFSYIIFQLQETENIKCLNPFSGIAGFEKSTFFLVCHQRRTGFVVTFDLKQYSVA